MGADAKEDGVECQEIRMGDDKTQGIEEAPKSGGSIEIGKQEREAILKAQLERNRHC